MNSKDLSRRWAKPVLALAPYAMVIVLVAIGAILIRGFVTWPSIRSLLVIAAFLGIASIGQTLVIILGGIDLSIPAVIGVANVLTIQLYGQGWDFSLVLVVVFAVSLLIGGINGAIARGLRSHPLIVTLATGSIVGGITLLFAQGNSIGSTPEWLTNAVSPGGTFLGLGLPPLILIWALISAAIIFLQRRTTFGRKLFALGSNPVAARLALVRPTPVWIITYALSALFAGITGVLLAGFSSGADPNIGDPYLFLSIGAVVIGGTSLLGGSGGYGRTIAGVLTVTILSTILIGKGFTGSAQQLVLGALIIVLVSVAGRQQHIRSQI